MRVAVCTFTEGDFDFIGMVFKDVDTGLEYFQERYGSYLPDGENAHDYYDYGFIEFKETEVITEV